MTSLVVCGSFQFVNYFYFYVNREKVYIEEFLKLLLSCDREDSSIQLLLEEAFRPFSNLTIPKEEQYLEDLILISSKLVCWQPDIKEVDTQKGLTYLVFTSKVYKRRYIKIVQ